MFKTQDNAYILLPTINPVGDMISSYDIFFGFYVVTLATKTLAILLRIIEQSSVDIFIMDWEKPKLVAAEDKEPSVIAWRSTFVANELNELQFEHRRINPETNLIWFSFFWVGLGWQYFSQSNPNFDTEYNPLEPSNMFLRFFWASFLFVVIAAVQYVLYAFDIMVNSSALAKFTDLCTVANCSVFLMASYFHGYYIHGRAPWEQSDLPAAWLKKELDNEK